MELINLSVDFTEIPGDFSFIYYWLCAQFLSSSCKPHCAECLIEIHGSWRNCADDSSL